MTNDFNSSRSGNFKPKLSPEEYAKAKQEEKEAVYKLIDTAISDIVNNPDEFQKYLDTQARMDRYSAANALLIYKQCPEATQLKYFNGFTATPLIRISKCRCGPLLRPVLPLNAIFCPCFTVCPGDTRTLLRCAYLVSLPSPWRI